jgi:hypothetical protein
MLPLRDDSLVGRERPRLLRVKEGNWVCNDGPRTVLDRNSRCNKSPTEAGKCTAIGAQCVREAAKPLRFHRDAP